MPTLEAPPSPKLEVTAVSPSSGRRKLLARDELKDLFTLLTGYEEALLLENSSSGATASAKSRLSAQFKVFGVDIDWFADKPSEDQPLFIAHFGPFEKPGYRLKDLLGIARETGILESTPPPTLDAQEPVPGGPADKKIFVVDDDDSVRDMIAFAVRADGFQVETFADGVEMLRTIHNGALDSLPDLILLDLMLPIKGGYEVMQQLQMSDARNIPVIVITGRLIDRDMVSIMRQEANLREFIQKPIYPKALLASIHNLLKTTAPEKAVVA